MTGIVVDDYHAMAEALPEADALDPHVLRRSVREHFAPERMVQDYMAAYEAAIDADRRDTTET